MMLPMLIFGGFFLQSDTVPKYFIWVKYISWFYYGSENLYSAQWQNLGYCNTELADADAPNSVVIDLVQNCKSDLLSDLNLPVQQFSEEAQLR